MGREIKFRAWDKDTREMISWQELLHADWSAVHSILTEEPFIALQYTGLKDRNGKEIYEGDILRISHREFPQKVYFNSEGYYGTCEFALFELNRSYGFEVIGNIYENPELIDSTESA